MEIVYKKIGELKPYENNPRKNDEAVDAVAASISEFGWKVPVVIDTDNREVSVGQKQRGNHCLQLP